MEGSRSRSRDNEIGSAIFSPNDLRIEASASREAEANAIAERIMSPPGEGVPMSARRQVSLGALQRQRRPEDILPQAHVPKAPTMRPVGAPIVRGFAVTRATCGCTSEVTAREKGIGERIAAYTACGQRKDVRDPFALEACVRKKVFGAGGASVPALGTADPETSTVRIADASELDLREKLLGEPATGPCLALRTRAMLVHEGQHLEQFDRIAKGLGKDFFAEFKKLEGDAQRMEKLRKKFPQETAKYESAWQESVSNNVQAETESYKAELDFYTEVRSAWSTVCGPNVPTPDVAAPEGEPGRGKVQRQASDGDVIEQRAVPGIVHEILGSAGQPLDVVTRTFMEDRFGYDFGRVRVHADARAAESARQVNAEAYTVGQHIAFATNRYDPTSDKGRRLLAHELAHTLQQGQGNRPATISSPVDASEHEADRIADHVGGSPSYRSTNTWLARKQTPWPAWHQQVLNDIAKFAGPSDGKSAEAKWPQLKSYLCKLSKDRAQSLKMRLSPTAPGLSGGTDDFPVYLKAKFPANYENTIGILTGLSEGKEPALCAPPSAPKAAPAAKPGIPSTEEGPKKTAPAVSAADESQCSVDVRAVDAGITGGIVGAKHLFLVITDKVGNQYGARGGPDVPGGFFALIETDFGRYEKGLFPDYDPSALSRTVLSGADACGKKDCVSDACREIDAAEVGYEAYGPNSNSVVSELLKACDIPREKPDAWAPGWDVPMFAPAGKGTGGEEGGRPYGDDSGGGGFHQ